MIRKTPIFLLIIFFFVINLQAQEIIKHVVKKGETVYQLSKQYNVDIAVIYRHNPTAETVIRIDETLSFPKTDKNAKPEIENGYLIHWVAVGETKIGLSRRYNISIPQLEQLNPQIVAMLQAGHKLRIPYNGADENLILVTPGETLYGISKRYGMTVDELISANADRLQGVLKTGQYLNVGKNKQPKATEEKQKAYVVKTGDTKTALSKKFGISIVELERLNPHIIPMLKVEDEIRLTEEVNSTESQPKEKIAKEKVVEKTPAAKEKVVVETSTEPSSVKYVDYTIQPKETLFGLSKKAGLTYDELMALNPQLSSGVQIGMVIKMPENSVLQTSIDQTDNATAKKSSETPSKIQSNDELLATSQKNAEKTLYFVTPFSESEIKDLKSNTQGKNETLKNKIDFLNGAQIAIEKAKSLGLKLNVQFLKSEEVETQKELQNKIKQEADAIILTSHRTQDTKLIKEYANPKTPVIVAQPENEYLNAENIFNALPSSEFERKTMLKYIKEKGGKVIVIQDADFADLSKLVNEYYPSAKYITASTSGDVDIDELKNSLSYGGTNFVIMNTTKSNVVLTATTALLEKVTQDKIQLVILESSKMPDSEKVSQNRLTILKMLYPSMEIPSSKSTNFIEEYTLKNNQKPTVQLLKGYDVTIDTVLRLFQAKSFRETAETIKSEQLTTKFDYKKNDSGSYSNLGISIMQCGENGVVKISD